MSDEARKRARGSKPPGPWARWCHGRAHAASETRTGACRGAAPRVTRTRDADGYNVPTNYHGSWSHETGNCPACAPWRPRSDAVTTCNESL